MLVLRDGRQRTVDSKTRGILKIGCIIKSVAHNSRSEIMVEKKKDCAGLRWGRGDGMGMECTVGK